MSTEEMRDRITRLEVLVGVEDPETGLRGDVRGARKDIGTLFSVLRGIERRIYMAIGGGLVALWVIEHVYGK